MDPLAALAAKLEDLARAVFDAMDRFSRALGAAGLGPAGLPTVERHARVGTIPPHAPWAHAGLRGTRAPAPSKVKKRPPPPRRSTRVMAMRVTY